MDIIGKTDGGYLCNLNSSEIDFITTGKWHSGDVNPDKMLGKTVKLHELFQNCRIVETFKTQREYQSVREQLEDLLKGLQLTRKRTLENSVKISRVEKFVEKTKKINKK